MRLGSRPLSALTLSEQQTAKRLLDAKVIERLTVSINPAIYEHLPGTPRALNLMMIDTMRVPAEKRIQEYLRRSRFYDRMTIYSTFGEIAFVVFMLGSADEAKSLASEIFDAVHKGVNAIEKNDNCDMRRGIKLYSVTNTPVLCG